MAAQIARSNVSGIAVCAVSAALSAGLAGTASAAEAERSFPSRPLRLIVPQAPGGSNDIFARQIGTLLGERLGKQVVVDNRPGADGLIGSEIVARASPDGYTLLMASTAFTMNPAVRKLPYDPVKSFDWVAMLGTGPVLLTVGPSLPVNSVQELLAVARAKPGTLTAASAGGFMHFVSAYFRGAAGIDMAIALYKGGFPALIDVMGGQTHLALPTVVTAAPHVRSGKLKAIASGGAKRSSAFPDLPTIAESGVPGYDGAIWWAFGITAGTPTAIVDRLGTEVAAVLKSPDVQKRFATEGAEVEYRSSADMRRMIPADIAKWTKVARDANMRAE